MEEVAVGDEEEDEEAIKHREAAARGRLLAMRIGLAPADEEVEVGDDAAKVEAEAMAEKARRVEAMMEATGTELDGGDGGGGGTSGEGESEVDGVEISRSRRRKIWRLF